MSQTSGGCRASNYIAFIRRALKKAGMGEFSYLPQLKRTGNNTA